MKKMFWKMTLMACIGLIFAVGCMLVTFGPSAQERTAEASTPHSVTIATSDPRIEAEQLTIIVIYPAESHLGVAPDRLFGPQTIAGLPTNTEVIVIAESCDTFEFKGFTGGETGTAHEITHTVTATTTITANFSLRVPSINLIIEGREGRNDVALGNSVRLSIDNEAEDRIYNEATGLPLHLMQRINSITFTAIQGHGFHRFMIRTKGGDLEELYRDSEATAPVNIVVDSWFINRHMIMNSDDEPEIHIIIELVKLHNLSIEASSLSEGMGTFTVEVDGVEVDWTNPANRYFESDTDVLITAIPNLFHRFVRFDAIPNPLLELTRTYTLNDDTVVTLHFREMTYEMDSDLDAVGSTELSRFRVGQTVVFSYEIPSNNTINRWRIRNSAGRIIADSHGTLRNINVGGGGMSVVLTGDMLTLVGENYVFDFMHTVDDSLNSGLLVAIIGGGVVIPILLIVLVAFMVINNRRKKLIKAQLEGKRTEKIKRDIGGYVSDLRSGADTGKITKAQIKAEMKSQKGQKSDTKAKPQVIQKAAAPAAAPAVKPPPAPMPKAAPAPAPEEAPAPAPAPVAPPEPPKPAPAPKLIGTKLTGDRTIVDGDGNVVAALNADGTITDKTGMVFASIRMTDGAIVGVDNKVLGIVQGDGTIQ